MRFTASMYRTLSSLVVAALALTVVPAGSLLAGCKEKETASTNALTAPSASAPASTAEPVDAAAQRSAAPAPLASAAASVTKASPKKPATTAKKGKGVELSIWDTDGTPERIESCGDGNIVVVLPLFPGADDWKVKNEKGLGTATRELRKGWRGPNSDSEAFQWEALKAKPGDYVATFTSGTDVVNVDIKIDPAHIPCD